MPHSAIQTPNWLRQMEDLLEALNEGLIVIDSQIRVVYVNEAFIRLTGYQRSEALGRGPEHFFPPEDIPYVMRQHETDERQGYNRHEFYIPRKDGGKIPAIFSTRRIYAPDGEHYILIIATDISSQKRVEGQLRESNTLLEIRQNEIDEDLSLAARVQQSLVPRSLVWNDVAVESYYSPARTIGGDFGVVLPHGDELLSVLVCDVSGHGIGSALVANRIYSETLHELDRKPGPGTLLRRLHNFVYERLAAEGFYFTMAVCRLVHRGRRMTFAAAGHPPAMLISGSDIRRLEARNGILGWLAETAPSELADEVHLNSGDRLVLYTDGLVEVFNENHDMLGVDGLERLVRESAQRPLPEMRQAILDGVAAWRHGPPLADDVSLILIEVR
jgi:phosphoserine phosphatase RsbU/P